MLCRSLVSTLNASDASDVTRDTCSQSGFRLTSLQIRVPSDCSPLLQHPWCRSAADLTPHCLDHFCCCFSRLTGALVADFRLLLLRLTRTSSSFFTDFIPFESRLRAVQVVATLPPRSLLPARELCDCCLLLHSLTLRSRSCLAIKFLSFVKSVFLGCRLPFRLVALSYCQVSQFASTSLLFTSLLSN